MAAQETVHAEKQVRDALARLAYADQQGTPNARYYMLIYLIENAYRAGARGWRG